jgi:hypothetical protein
MTTRTASESDARLRAAIRRPDSSALASSSSTISAHSDRTNGRWHASQLRERTRQLRRRNRTVLC